MLRGQTRLHLKNKLKAHIKDMFYLWSLKAWINNCCIMICIPKSTCFTSITKQKRDCVNIFADTHADKITYTLSDLITITKWKSKYTLNDKQGSKIKFHTHTFTFIIRQQQKKWLNARGWYFLQPPYACGQRYCLQYQYNMPKGAIERNILVYAATGTVHCTGGCKTEEFTLQACQYSNLWIIWMTMPYIGTIFKAYFKHMESKDSVLVCHFGPKGD